MEDIVGDISRRDEVLAAIRESFDDDTWVERNMFSLNGVQKYTASWEQFCEAVKHQTRYFFNFDPEEESHDTIPVLHMLDTLREMAQESGMLRTLPADRLIYRVRSHKRLSTARRAKRWVHRLASTHPVTG